RRIRTISSKRSIGMSCTSDPYLRKSLRVAAKAVNAAKAGTSPRHLAAHGALFLHVLESAPMKASIRKSATLILAGSFLLSGWLAARAAEKRGVTAEDYFAFQFVNDPRVSPDGKQVAYVLSTINQKKNRRESAIWLVPVDGSAAPRRL